MNIPILIPFLVLINVNIFAQFDPPANICATAPVLCDLDGYTYNNAEFNSSQGTPNSFCGIVENNCWISFRAFTPILRIQITLSNCQNGQGLQAAMFASNNCQFFTSVANCINPVYNNSTAVLNANNLEIGGLYYIMMDGKGGDVCDFRFDLLEGSTSPIADLPLTTAVCPGDSISLGKQIPVVYPYTYEWTTNNGNFISDPNTTSVSVNGAGTYTITIIDPVYGCADFANIVVTEYPLIDIPVPLISGFCFGESMTLGSEIPTTSTNTYQWETSNGNIISDPNMATISVNEPGIYTIIGTDAEHGCDNSVDVTVTEYPLPIIDITIPDTLHCRDAPSVTIDASKSDQGDDYMINWTGFGILNGADSYTPEIDFPATYYVNLTNTATTCVQMDSISVFADSTSPYAALIHNETQLECLFPTVFLDASASTTGPNFNYEWQINNNSIINDTDLVIEVDSAATYTLSISNNFNDCISTATVDIVDNRDIPTAIDFDLKPPCFDKNNAQVNILNVTNGTAPYRYSLNEQAFTDNPRFDDLAPGTYPIVVQDSLFCEWDSILTISPVSEFIVDIGEDLVLNLGDNLILEPFISNAIQEMTWSTDDLVQTCDNCNEWTTIPLQGGFYELAVIDKNDCLASDKINVKVLHKEKVFIPSAFSPNADGINDEFIIFGGKDVHQIKQLNIFDRWGNQVFKNSNFQKNTSELAWDGFYKNRLLDPQVLTYVAQIEFINGITKQYVGDINLIY